MLELKKILKRKDSMIMLALSLWALMLSVLNVIFPDVFSIEANAKMGAFDFLYLMIIIQDLVFLPVLIMVYSASLTFYSEIDKKQIYMYKDTNRRKTLNQKYLATYGLYLIYLILYILISILSYYLIINKMEFASGTFFTIKEDILSQLYEIIQVVLGIIFYINIGIFFALRYPSGVSIFLTTLLYMFLKIAPLVETISYLIPIGYRSIEINTIDDFWKYILISLIIFSIYNIFVYVINFKKFKSMEFR